ncbi:hypothetical protein [Actibacterium sp. 188UL27-1]|uniref:hypothetical protein n=1 Tax=Actibacterium sp. 188UL27-1 TaxID=2786961 RepID=UPI00195A8D13|nr:hypothetical protein [Actibacterium sp. 188UL27-1]MBM7066382.1 hypothetical protein [Actibacterium sp. 188UL27-1]
MKDMLALFESWRNAIWAIGAASAFCFSIATGAKHLSDDAKADLALYLESAHKDSWACAHCLSSWFIKGFTKLCLHKLLAVTTATGTSLALTGSIGVFAAVLALKPVIALDETGRAALDAKLCDLFPREIYIHVARLTEDQQQKTQLPVHRLQRRPNRSMLADRSRITADKPFASVDLARHGCSEKTR